MGGAATPFSQLNTSNEKLLNCKPCLFLPPALNLNFFNASLHVRFMCIIFVAALFNATFAPLELATKIVDAS